VIIDELNSLNNILLSLDDIARSANSPNDVRLLNLEKLLNNPGGPLQRCRTELQALELKLSAPVAGLRGIGKTLMWPLKEKEIQRLLDTIRAQKSTCDFALNADNA
jgi:hypothetical protein